MIGINSEAIEPERIARVAAVWGFAYPVVIDGTSEVALAYGVTAYPTLALVDREGIVRRVFAGDPGERVLAREIEKLLE